MGRASELAAELNAAQATNETARKTATDAYRVIADYADELWNLSVTATMGGIKEFTDEFQAAKDAFLMCERLNQNTLIVSTKVVPLLKLNIIYNPKRRIFYEIVAEQFTARSLPKPGARGEFWFTVDRQLQPHMTDGDRFLVPQQVADELIDLVGAFFRKAQARPSILS
jgi:hypothetical protein